MRIVMSEMLEYFDYVDKTCKDTENSLLAVQKPIQNLSDLDTFCGEGAQSVKRYLKEIELPMLEDMVYIIVELGNIADRMRSELLYFTKEDANAWMQKGRRIRNASSVCYLACSPYCP